MNNLHCRRCGESAETRSGYRTRDGWGEHWVCERCAQPREREGGKPTTAARCEAKAA